MPRRVVTIIIATIATLALAWAFWGSLPGATREPRGDFGRALTSVLSTPKAVKSVAVIKGDTVTVTYRDPRRKPVKTSYPDERSLHDLVAAARKGGVPVYARNPPAGSILRDLAIQLIPMILFFALFMAIMGRASGLGKLLGGARHLTKPHAGGAVTFKDVAGLESARQEVMEVVDFLEDPKRFEKLGARVPRGILFVGPPGTGKTLLAKAAAGESGAAFFSVTGSDFVEMIVGLGAGRVRDIFKKARAAAPAIIFIDEIDAVGRARAAHGLGGNDEREQTLNQLLSEMDGFATGEAVVVIAATNRPDVLDPALLRPGRFDRQITVDRPDVKGRLEILQAHAAGKPLDEKDLPWLASQTPGFTGAELANLLNEAALIAARRRAEAITRPDLAAAWERVVAGLERARVMSDQERRITAWHEAGHALCAHCSHAPQPVRKISIVSRGQALGFTVSAPEQERMLETRESLTAQLVVLLGGRAAEEAVFGTSTSGAASDLERATKIASEMILRFGMGDGTLADRAVLESPDGRLAAGPDLASEADRQIAGVIAQAKEQALAILEGRRDDLEAVALRLLDAETIERDEFLELIGEPEAAGGGPAGSPEGAPEQ